jgi:hypothetical protein
MSERAETRRWPMEFLLIIAFVVVYFALQLVILPRLGVPT